MTDDEKLLEIVRLDYDRTNGFITDVLGTTSTIRGWSITIVVALVGLAFDRDLWPLAALASVVVLLFAFLDLYHSWLYAAALRHAADIERAIGSYHRYLAQKGDDPQAAVDYEADVKGHSFGLLRNVSHPSAAALLKGARPRAFIFILYTALIAVSCLSTFMILK